MSVLLLAVYTRELRGFSAIAIGVIVGFVILFLAFISGAPMDPARLAAPTLLSGILVNLWLYVTATFIGTGIIAFAYKKII